MTQNMNRGMTHTAVNRVRQEADSPLRAIDYQVGRQILAYEKGRSDLTEDELRLLEFAAQMVSAALGKGQVCLPVCLPDSLPAFSPATADQTRSSVIGPVMCPVMELDEEWQSVVEDLYAVLQRSFTVFNPAASDASAARYQHQPLVLNNGRLYLARYYFYEQGVLQQIHQRIGRGPEVEKTGEQNEDEHAALQQVLNELFASADSSLVDWQKVAAATACLQQFTVITGGPGTGKTTTVTRLLSALISQSPQMSIALAAPTGKAAARMTESIRQAKLNASNGNSLPYAGRIPDESYTLHRLLGWTPNGFRYNAEQTLPFDCVVVDEASMVDLPMMFHLFAALSPATRLILLGDKDQLASVEAGSVLADLCDAGQQHGPDAAFAAVLQQLTECDLTAYTEPACGPMQNAMASLRISHRFDANSGIGHLAAAVNRSDAAAAEQAFAQFDDVTFDLLETQDIYWQQPRWREAVTHGYRDFCNAVSAGADAAQVFAAFNRFQVLVALRQGPYGVEQVNLRIEQLLRASGLLSISSVAGALAGQTSVAVWYPGRPVMISRNDYDLGLFNGDIGIALLHTDDDGKRALRVAFPDEHGGVRWLLPGRLPAHETAFAMTVHKSQGSEFDKLCLLLPEFWQSVITRELIYTAVTRGKKEFHLFSGQACWQQGILARVHRASGLRDALWNTSVD